MDSNSESVWQRRAPRAGDYERAGAAARGRTSCSSADGRPVFSAALARAGRGVRASFCERLRARAQRGAARRGDGSGNASRARQARPAGEKTTVFPGRSLWFCSAFRLHGPQTI